LRRLVQTGQIRSNALKLMKDRLHLFKLGLVFRHLAILSGKEAVLRPVGR
jgi:hypothetical protein